MQPVDRSDQKLDELLGRLRGPVPPGALERSWQAIDAKLEWRKPMSPFAFMQTVRRPRWAAAIASAAVVFLALVVGLMHAPRLGGGIVLPGRFPGGANREEAILKMGQRDVMARNHFETDTEMGRRTARGRESGISDIPLGGTGTTGGIGGGGRRVTKDRARKWAVAEDEETKGKGGGKPGVSSTLRPYEPSAPAGELSRVAEVLRDVSKQKSGAGYEKEARKLLSEFDKKEATDWGRNKGKKKKYDRKGRRPYDRPSPKRPPPMKKRGTSDPRGPRPTEAPGERPARSARKIIKTATLELEVRKFADAGRKVDSLVARYRGFYADSKVTQNSDGTSGGYYVIRVPQAGFEALYAELKKLGRVKVENAKGEDVTAAYTDRAARIRNAQHMEQRLLALLAEKKRGRKMSEILEVERELGKKREEIERMQGTMRVMQDKIEFGTIYLTVAEPSRTVPSGSLGIEVKDASVADKALDPLMIALGGQVASRKSTKRSDGTTVVEAEIKAPMPQFGKLVDKLKAMGRVDREDVRGYNPAAITADPGAKDVLAAVSVELREPPSQKRGGVVNVEVKTLESAAAAIGDLLKRLKGTLVSRKEQRRQGIASATYVVRVPRARFAELVASLGAVGRIERKDLVGVDVLDVEGRAAKVPCDLVLYLYERSRQTPNANAMVSTTDLSAAASALQTLLKTVDSQVLTHTENRVPGGTSSASYALRCRRGNFPALVAGLASVGRVERKAVQGLDPDAAVGAAADTLCTLALTVIERRAPVPGAAIEIQVADAEAASAKLKSLRDSLEKTQTEGVDKDTQEGASTEVWRLRVRVADFEKFVADVEKIGEVKTRKVHGVGSGAEEKPDPEALARVAVTLHKPRPVTRPREGTFRGMLGAAFKTLYWLLGALLYGLIVLVPLAFIIALIVKLIVRMVRSKQGGPAAAGAPEGQKNE